MSDETDPWADFANTLAAIDEQAASEREAANNADAEARKRFEADAKELGEWLADDNWDAITRKYGYNVTPEDIEADGSGPRPVSPDPDAVPTKVDA